MLAIVFLFISFIFGWLFVRNILRLNPEDNILNITASFLIGNFLSVWIVFIFASIFSSLLLGILSGLLLTVTFSIFTYSKGLKGKFERNIPKHDAIISGAAFLFSFWFMEKVLGRAGEGILRIGADVWGDFELHLPLIRSFSWGNNVPPSSPFFPNENLAYHFLFDFWAAILEFLGLHLTSAVNVVSILSFTSLLIIIYKFGYYFFPYAKKKIAVGIIAVVLFLFNSSFGFIDAIKKLQPTDLFDFAGKILQNSQYLSVHPFQDDKVSIIWNLNVYANQRHLVIGIALALLLLLFLKNLREKDDNKKSYLLIGVIWGLLPFWQTHIFLSLGLIFGMLFLLEEKWRKGLVISILIGSLLAFPQLYWLAKDVQSSFIFNPGFLAYKPFTLMNALPYWVYNLGFSLITIPLGIWLVRKEEKRWFFAFLSIFLVANVFQFNKEMLNNHKFLNFWILFANFYTAYLLVFIGEKRRGWILTGILLLFLTMSGIIDFMVTKNQQYFLINDDSRNPRMLWIKENTPQNAIFLTPYDEMYHPVRLAGRKTYQYKPRYAWAYGYNVENRDIFVKNMYEAQDPVKTKVLFEENDIRYVILPGDEDKIDFKINYDFFRSHFSPVFADEEIEIVKLEREEL